MLLTGARTCTGTVPALRANGQKFEEQDMTLVIPGIEVKVVKEVLAPQLAPSGVLGLVGSTERQPTGGLARVQSWNAFVEQFGPGSAWSMPEAAQALSNGVFELVVSAVAAESAQRAQCELPADGGSAALVLQARAPGTWANELKIEVKVRGEVFDLTVQRPGGQESETHRNLSTQPEQLRYVKKVLDEQSQVVRVASVTDRAKLQESQAGATACWRLAGGSDAEASAYRAALGRLDNVPEVDLVMASVGDVATVTPSAITRLRTVYADLVAHSERQASRSQGRIAFAQVPGNTEAELEEQAKALAENLVSDRLVWVAPGTVAGAVAGRIGQLEYFQSPTFKALAVASVSPALGVETQQALLNTHALPVVSQRGRGVIMVRGLTSDGDQINVRRVADRAVRGMQTIGEQFIGRLNNESGRMALKQNLIAFLVQMEKDGAVVPSTDGSDPAFKVNVYASQTDFSQGIVRVDLAVRPVRAIDYIYATVLVQV
jgi:hypothetical protein